MNGARVIDTGVPRMKVTEYPLSPRIEETAAVITPGCQDCTATEASDAAAVQHSSSEVIVVPAQQETNPVTPASPAPQAAPLVPVPEKNTIPPQA